MGGDPGIGEIRHSCWQSLARWQSGGFPSPYTFRREEAAVRLPGCGRGRLGLARRQFNSHRRLLVRDHLERLCGRDALRILSIDFDPAMHSDLIEAAPGTVSQVRASAQESFQIR